MTILSLVFANSVLDYIAVLERTVLVWQAATGVLAIALLVATLQLARR